MKMSRDLTIPVIGIERLRMSTDGYGIRTLIGAYGCPLRCKYCLNPHSWNGKTKPRFYSPQELYQKVYIDNIYFQATKGGVTFGGGEPLLYSDFIAEFKKLCPDTWSLWVETSLNVPYDNVERAADVFDCFVVDIKSMDESIYERYTGGILSTALDNLKQLLNTISPDRIIVRVPLIPDFSTKEDQISTVQKLKELGVTQIDTFIYSKK